MKNSIALAGLALLAGAACVGGAPARAQDAAHPQLMPTRDVTVDYDVTHEGATVPQKVRVYFGADGGRLRVDGPDGVGATILDRTAQQVTVILNRNRVYAQFNPQNGLQNPFLLDISMKFTRKGDGAVAGQPCTKWDIEAKQGKATACVTADGVILEEEGVDSDGMRGHLVARTVTYGPIASSEFVPPEGFMKVTHGRPSSPSVSPNAPPSAAQPLTSGTH